MIPSMAGMRKVVSLSLTAAVAQGLIALITNSFRVFFGLFGPYAVAGMVAIYFDYATRALHGQVPYRDYLVEYPILGFFFFLVPSLLVSDMARYRVLFSVQLLLFNA